MIDAGRPFLTVRFVLMTVVSLALIAATASLGFWQLSRAQQKLAQHAAMLGRENLAPWSAQELLGALASDRALGQTQAFHPLQLRGHWVKEATLYLDNRQMKGRPGFYVYTHLRLADSGAVVAVERGWAPRDFDDRTRLPQVVSPDDEVVIQGRIGGEPSRLFEFSPPVSGQGASPILQNLTVAAYADEFSLSLLPLTVVQTGAPSDGLQRDWPTRDSGVDTNYGYAFQWFGLCALVTVLYVWFQIVRRLTGRPGDAAERG